ncbi:MAG: ferrous iron transport protein B [Candidatus Margulisbacteria bacterium]|nr:ferrous iron transport protein B [Candidatus Margulisiibacteriota bacterium]
MISMPSCHSELKKISRDSKFVIALAGNPNVGKSTIFNQLTGLGAVTANYPGKTVALNMGTADYKGTKIGIVDLPGTYSLGSVSDDQLVARREILEGAAEIIVSILDATNLERNLYMVLQLLDLGYPVIVALNLSDLAAQKNICIDHQELSRILGVPVIPVVGTTGEGIEQVIKTCIAVHSGKLKLTPNPPKYGKDIEAYIELLASRIKECVKKNPYRLSSRALATLLLEEDAEFMARIAAEKDCEPVLKTVKEISADIERTHGERASLRFVRERHGLEGSIVDRVETLGVCKISLADRLWRWTIEPVTGIPILLFGLMAVFITMYYVGGFLSNIFEFAWTAFVSPHINELLYGLLGHNALSRTLLWGFDAGIKAALSVGIPFVMTFYIILAFLEDTGYLNSIAFLTDSLMHKLGLHGRAIIPIIAGAGCNVPAIIGTRVLTTKREKIIACTLIILTPCSARTAVIMGAVAFFVGWQYALAIYAIDFVIGILVGRTMAVLLPGESSGLVMEMFPFRAPKLTHILKKTWYRVKEFVLIALPIIAVGSLVMGTLYETQYMWLLTKPMSLIIESWLGLPAVAGICLLFGILRKELALELLLALAIVKYGPDIHNLLSFMTKQQLFIFALVTTLYFPCVAALTVLVKELGWKVSIAIVIFTVVLAVLVGGFANIFLNAVKIF